MTVIQTENLTKYYGRARGVEELSLAVDEGDIFGFIGPNGAGKSTTIRTLLGLISPTSGVAKVFGLDCRGNRERILADIGYLPSETVFYSDMRAGEVIRLSAKLRRKDCSAESAALCERLGLDPKKKVSDLSLGNRKKVGLVCALQHRPALYLLDEPTSGLDPLIQKELWSLLEERHREGATVFLSSHVLSEVQRHCKNAAIIREGRLAAAGSVAELSGSAAKHVSLQGPSSPPELPGVRNVQISDGGVSFLYQGELAALISALGNMPVTDLSISEPDLEEIFMHYYEGEEK